MSENLVVLKWVNDMFHNYYKLKISGKDVKRFIKQLYNMHIYFENIEFSDKSVYVKVDKDNYSKIQDIKTIYKIEVVRLYGPNRLRDIIHRYNIFFISIIIGLLMLNVLGNILFEIEIDTDNQEIYELVSRELHRHGIKKFSLIKPFSEREKIISDILEDNKEDLEWMEIERVGVKYIVRVEERIIKRENEQCPNRHIIAKKEGLILSIVSSHGEIKKAINDYVKKGDIIVSGIITKNEDEKNRVCAEGRIFAETWYQIKVEVPYNYKEIIYTKEKKKNLSITIFNKRFALFQDYADFVTEEKTLKNNILPLKLSIEDNQKIIKIDHIYTSEELDLKALEISREKLLTILGDDDEILLEKKLKTTAKDSTIEVVIFFKVKEDITAYQEIE